jgi:catechol 2,3-dioxygenase-like lactoylglutathione lyase family enzyme
MFDHIVLIVSDPARSASFFKSALKPLGITHYITYEGQAGHADLTGLGDDREAYLLLRKGKPTPTTVHFAFRAKSQKAVDAFYKAALAAGGRDNGAPGPRLHYFAGYYAAYVLDPDGYNVEAVHQS